MLECFINIFSILLKKSILKYTIYLFSIILISAISLAPVKIYASDELSNIEQQINDAKTLQQQKQKDLNDAQSLLTALKNQSYAVSSNMSDLKNQITDIQNKTTQINVQINSLEQNISNIQSLIESEKTFRDSQIRQYFMDSYVSNQTSGISFIQGVNLADYQTSSAVKSYAITTKKYKLDDILQKYNDLSLQHQQIEDLKKQLTDQNTILTKKQQDLQGQLSSINGNIGSTNAKAQSLRSTLNNLNSNLSYLDAKHATILEQEIQKLATAAQAQQTALQSGQYFFLGRGRDLIEGHGMGMSQWGAYGEALNFGWTYDQILKFYYTGVTIGTYAEPEKIVVDGKTGPISFQDYLSGIGEVPNDWPAEAIKAQVVAARTYAMRTAYKGGDGYMHICGTDACQVYLGGTAKSQYVLATKSKVILYGGQPIVAYFSASHRGCSSSLSTVWGSTDLPYIQTVHDDAYAYKDYKSSNPYDSSQLITTYNWQWRTNGYDLNQLSQILSRSPSTDVGTLQKISTTKDSCGRVAKVTLTGTKNTINLTGWDFRAIFNDITPFNDYIYSTEFSFEKK